MFVSSSVDAPPNESYLLDVLVLVEGVGHFQLQAFFAWTDNRVRAVAVGYKSAVILS